MDNLVQFEEDFNNRSEMWWGGGVIGYLIPDQFLDHLTVIKSREDHEIAVLKASIKIISFSGFHRHIAINIS